MKKLFILITFFSLVLSGCTEENKTANNQKIKQDGLIEIIGIYSHGFTSMCAQNCENINLGPFSLTTGLNISNTGSNNMVYLKGKVVEVMELPTVAGPNSKMTDESSKKQKRNKIKPMEYEIISPPKFSINEQEMNSYLNNENAKINMTFTNPYSKKLKIKLKFTFDKGKFQTYEFLPSEQKTITSIIEPNSKNSNTRSKYIDYLIINDFVEDISYYMDYKNYSKHKNKNLIFIRDSINLEDVIE